MNKKVLFFLVLSYASCKEQKDMKNEMELLNNLEAAVKKDATRLKWLETSDALYPGLEPLLSRTPVYFGVQKDTSVRSKAGMRQLLNSDSIHKGGLK